MGLPFEGFEVGRTWRTASRIIAESDILSFAELSGDFTPIHVDEATSRRGPFGARIAHGPLPMSIAIGLMSQLGIFDGTVVGLLNLNWDFHDVVRIGDAVTAKITVVERRPTAKQERGLVKLEIDVTNQHGTCVQRGVNTVLVLTAAGLEAAP
jgi:acyl dehydratase